MNSDDIVGKPRQRAGLGKQPPSVQYTDKDFQLEVLGKLAETQALAGSLQDSLQAASRMARDERLLRFDGRTLVAIGAIALSLTGYVLQDARNKTRQDTEIETTKTRVTRLEQIAEANTEGRIRTEVQLGELRDGQIEIKNMIKARDKESTGIRGEDSRREKAQSAREDQRQGRQ
ncbi:MAG: hypothetical protein LAO24_00950 [Acidobacteriia bacterium]|nr:hypothetical protein [Terriglobia bacterium]